MQPFSRNKLPFTFKYYPPKILLRIAFIVLAISIAISFSWDLIQGKQWDNWKWLVKIITSVSVPILFFSWFNRRANSFIIKLLGLPDLRGEFAGELISSYYVNDDPNQGHVKKLAKLYIDQNLNGFYVQVLFSDTPDFSEETTTMACSLSHDIQQLPNGNFEITYRYENKGNAFHEQKEVGFNRHRGIAILEFDPRAKTLVGSYFNDGAERVSYGTLKFNKHEK